ncbi:MAG TPA: 5'/3'-nucleotidase SurE [Euzebyales bacterium]|nr:5'/3'-nucleotidase SurE [Euzebyales bacterium]
MRERHEPSEIEVDASEHHAADDGGRARCRLLLTNDDGIGSPGLRELARALAVAHDLVVAAPEENVSGAGTSIGAMDAEAASLRRADFDGIEAYAVHGPPGLAVMAAALGAFGDKPDVVVSGPNAGLNTGTSIIHSGTVGAALTGHTFGSHGVAFSMAPGERWYWETAAALARDVVTWVVRQPELVVLNVNVPALPPGRVRGTRWARIDEFGHFNVASQSPDGVTLDLGVRDRRSGVAPDSDTALCLDGYVTLTLLSPLEARTAPDDDAAAVTGR